MTYFPDLSESTMVCAGEHVRAVGWLSNSQHYATGTTDNEFQERLQAICQKWICCVKELGFGIFMGFHTCEFCEKFDASGNIAIPAGGLLYVAPEMIYHYVTQHQYLPPKEFIEAVKTCPLPDSEEYRTLVQPFRDLQEVNNETRLG